jgi:hypothetical protein
MTPVSVAPRPGLPLPASARTALGRLARLLALACLVFRLAQSEDRGEGADAVSLDGVAASRLLDLVAAPGGSAAAVPGLLTAEVQAAVVQELAASPATRRSLQKLALSGPSAHLAWFAGVEELERQRAVWPLLACLAHRDPDVQIVAVAALARLMDRRSLPGLLAYARTLDVVVAGSENATIHGIAQAATAKALSDLAGLGLSFTGGDGQEHLRAAIAACGRR